MTQQFQFLDIIFLGIIVVLLINRLRSVLGTRPMSDENSVKSSPKPLSKVVDISEYRTVENQKEVKLEQDFEMSGNFEENAEIINHLKEIKEKYPSFSLAEFMQKAPRAFEYIALAFAQGNKENLKPLLSSSIYQKFETVIDERKERKETAEFSLIRFKSIELSKAELTGSMVELTVEFETEQTNIVKNEQGDVILGDATYIETIVDVWTLRKDMNSRNPNWILTATHSKVFI